MACMVRPFTLALLSLALAGSSTRLFSQVVYVVNQDSNDVSAYSVDAGTGALTAIPGSPFPVVGPVPVGPNVAPGPNAAALDPTGKFLYLTGNGSAYTDAYVVAFTTNAATGALTPVPGSPFALLGSGKTYLLLSGAAVDPTGKSLYVSDGAPFTLNINAGSGVLTGGPTYPAIDYGTNVVLSPTGKFVFTTTGSGVTVFAANATSGAFTLVPGSPFFSAVASASLTVDPTGKFVYAPNNSECVTCPPGAVSAYSVNASSGALTAIPGSPFPDTGIGAVGAAVDPTGKFLFVSNYVSGNVSAYTINAGSGALTAVPGSPFGFVTRPQALAVDPSGKFLYVTSYVFDASISAYSINPSSGALTSVPGSPLPAGKYPVAIAIRSQPIAPSVAITAIAPNSATAGAPAFTLTVTGTGFLSGATVQWNGSPLLTTFSSATQLTAAVPASLIAVAGSASVTVAAGGVVSKPASFTINPVGISISSNGVLNAATQSGGPVSPGEIVGISGSGFGPSAFTNFQLDGNGYVTTTLAGVQALFDGTPAPLLGVQAGQVIAVVPYEVSGNPSTQLQISYQGQTSTAVTVPVAVAAPGIFTADSSGGGQGMIVNADGSANSAGNPASAGSVVLVSATGEGQTSPPGVDGKPGDSPAPVPLLPVTATIGGLDAPVQSAGGISGTVAGFLQLSVQIPPDVTVGPSVPIVLTIGGIATQANVTIAIQ
jgi:uncharacterized protein (TIGR03437 family)